MSLETGHATPRIDKRDFNDLLSAFEVSAGTHVPEWKLTEAPAKDPGAALVRVFLHMMTDVTRRLNRVPEKYFAAFLDAVGVTRRPPGAASAPVTFVLAEGTAEHVLIPAKTQTAAGDIIFETEKNILATPARLTALYSAAPGPDKLFQHPVDFDGESAFEIFDGADLQQHMLYLGHKTLFDIAGPSTITVELGNGDSNAIGEPWLLSWEYFGEDGAGEKGWHPLTLQQVNPFQLKVDAGTIDEHEVNGVTSRWIRCLVNPGGIHRAGAIEIDSVQVKVAPPDAGASPDTAFYNDIPLDMNDKEGFYPFGKTPRLHGAFYIACREAFSKKGAEVTLTVTGKLECPAGTSPAVDPQLSWEYWNGSGWLDIPGVTDKNNIIANQTFTCPHDIRPTVMNGRENYWIRVRFVGGHYGKEFVITGDKLTPGVVTPPKITSLSISYSVSVSCASEHVLIYNNLEYEAVTGSDAFRPFRAPGDNARSLYLGFDKKIEKGPISIFFSIQEADPDDGAAEIPKINWCYFDGGQWRPLETIDNARGFTASGAVEFLVPPGFAPTPMFGEDLYWLKAVGADGKVRERPVVKGVYINTVTAVQGESIQDEILGSGDGGADQTFRFIHHPVMDETVWVDETRTITGEEQDRIIKNYGHDYISRVTDAAGKVEAVWVRRLPRDDFMDSGSGDRHYVMDRAAGTVTFGSGLRGMAAPMGKDNIKASYRTGGGAQGNVARHDISELKTGLPFIDHVVNPHPAEGGADTELMPAVFQRGPCVIKHRNRAVSEEDFERLAREASAFIARSKCLVRAGRVNVFIIPQGEQEAPAPSPVLLKTVETYLRQRCLNTLLPRDIRVLPPDYIPVDVSAVVVPVSIDMAEPLEKEILSKLRQFLHPLTGGPGQTGWEFGRDVHLSDIYAMLERIDGVDYVAKLELNGRPADVTVEDLNIACPGRREITITPGGE